ncbi:hypothetical protein FRC00_001630 [Tulasnella sp. 408]|nr:hypothetical protein FRC00_001630 [Tulasnella sp. 408]
MDLSEDGAQSRHPQRPSGRLRTVRVVLPGGSGSKPPGGSVVMEDDHLNRSSTSFSDAVISRLTAAGVSGERAVTLVKRLEQDITSQAKRKHSNIFVLDDFFRDTSPTDVPSQALVSALRDASGLSRHINVTQLGLEERFELILTGSAPYSAANGDGAILMAMIQGVAPGNPDSLLRLTSRTGEQDYSGALMCASASIRDCWSFDSSRRPRIPGLRRQLFKFLEKDSDATMNALVRIILRSK